MQGDGTYQYDSPKEIYRNAEENTGYIQVKAFSCNGCDELKGADEAKCHGPIHEPGIDYWEQGKGK